MIMGVREIIGKWKEQYKMKWKNDIANCLEKKCGYTTIIMSWEQEHI